MYLPTASIFLLASSAAARSLSSFEPADALHARDADAAAKPDFDGILHPRSAAPQPYAAPAGDAELKLKLAISHLVRRALVARGKKPDLKLAKTDIDPRLRNPPAKKNDPKAKAAYSGGQKDHHQQGLQHMKDKGAKMPDPKDYKKDGGAYSSGRPPFFDKVKFHSGHTPDRYGLEDRYPFDSSPKPLSQPHSEQGKPYLGTGFHDANKAPTQGHWWNP